MSKGARQRLNRAVRDQCRPAHCEKLCYVLPDRSKKACLTWQSGIELYIKEVGHAPVWADHKIECKVCKKFFRDENAWQVHFVQRHSDADLFGQCLRRIQNWNTQEEVESAIELVYDIGQQVGMSNKDIESSILEATRVPGIKPIWTNAGRGTRTGIARMRERMRSPQASRRRVRVRQIGLENRRRHHVSWSLAKSLSRRPVRHHLWPEEAEARSKGEWEAAKRDCQARCKEDKQEAGGRCWSRGWGVRVL